MLEVHFAGWFQCRLATGPADPVDEPRGVSGWTCAVGDEPNLDRIIRFSDFVSPRSHGPELGVVVSDVTEDGARSAEASALVGAKVDLLDQPVFVGRNGVIFELAEEPIDPFHLRVSRGELVLQRQDVTTYVLPDPQQDCPPTRRVEDVLDEDGTLKNPRFDWPLLQRRLPTSFAPFSTEVGEATGILDYAAYRELRKQKLIQALTEATEEVDRLALEKRIRELQIQGRRTGLRQISLGFQLSYQFELNGAICLEDPLRRLKGTISTEPNIHWPIQFWLGAYDADALAAFVKGTLRIPYRL